MMRTTLALGFVLLAATVSAACSDTFGLGGGNGADSPSSSGGASGAPGSTPEGSTPVPVARIETPDPFAGLPKGAEQTAKVCGRGRRDRVIDGLCSGATIDGIDSLLGALKLSFRDPSARGSNGGSDGNPGFVLLGHSSSLIAKNVSAVNPRAFVFTSTQGAPRQLPGYTVVGFTRGETFVEIASQDRNTGKLTLYLVKFDIDCEAKHTCTNGDIFQGNIESGWRGFTLYDDTDLGNTILDCNHCHQPDKSAPKGLLMRELRDPWTHWLRKDKEGGAALFVDFLRVHGDESYGGIPKELVQKSDPRALEDLVVGQGFAPSDENLFDSRTIETEVKRVASQQPVVNTPAGSSSTWQRLYDKSLAGRLIPPPYHDVKVTDPGKLLFVSHKYVALKKGEIAGSDLPDMRQVFLDDAMEELSFYPRKGASGEEVLLHTCGQCHHPDLDQGISRAKFDVSKLATMDRGMRETAIARMMLPPRDLKKMPPVMMRELTKEALDAAVAHLRK
jgi:hypothetical protein